MPAIAARFNYLFRSTKGLTLVAIAMIALATAFFGMLSGPMAELGIRDVWVRTFGISLDPMEREGRIIILYHAIAMAVVAIETYFITALVKIKEHERTVINSTITAGYLLSLVFGLAFAYFGRIWVFHGLFISGMVLIFFAGVVLSIALWPWRAEYHVRDRVYANFRGKLDLERTAFFTMAVCTLGSALFGAIPASYFGNGFQSFLAEDIVREPVKTGLQLAVIGHLHIMLTLMAVALALIVGRWLDFKGTLHKIAMPLMIAGTITVTLGVWLVVPFEEIAHYIIYAGSVLVLPASLLLVVYGWRSQVRHRLAELNLPRANFSQKLGALLHDPLKFGALWQMVFMNFVTTFIGIFMAIRLDKTIRVWPWREERITLTGHWHILSGIIATIILLYYADLLGLQGRARRWFGWLIIIFSDLAFASVTVFEIKRLFVGESAQQPLVDWTMLLTDTGLASVLLVLAGFLLWRLVDLFRRRGRWRAELAQAGLEPPGAGTQPVSSREVTR